MNRVDILRVVDEAYAARARGDAAGVVKYLAPGATFQLAGEVSLLPRFPVGPDDAGRSLRTIIDLVKFHSYERTDAIVEGHGAAVLTKATLSVGGLPPITVDLYDLWKFDADGKVASVIQFTDTAKLSALLTKAGAEPAPA